MHKRDQESILIATLLEGHTITAACKRAGVSRMFYGRHYKNDRDFRQQVDDARAAGRNTNDDLVTTMYFKKIRDGHWPAIHYAVKKKNDEEAKNKKGKQELNIGDIRSIINMLPEEAQKRHYDNIRDLLGDSAEFQQTGKVSPYDPNGL
jgi:hypothetical protein